MGKKNNEKVYVELPKIAPLKGNQLRDAVRVYLIDIHGKKKAPPRKFENKPEWIKIKDEDLFKELFGSHEWRACEDFEDWAIYVHKESRRFAKSEELKAKYKELLIKTEEELILFISKFKKEIKDNAVDFLATLNFYQLEELVKEMTAKKEAEKKAKKEAEELAKKEAKN